MTISRTPAGRIDRASHLRKDTDALMAALDDPKSLFVPLWRSKNLIVTAPLPRAVLLPGHEAKPWIDCADEIVWLGLWDGAHCFALDLSSRQLPPVELADAGGEFADLLMTGGLIASEQAEVLAYARGVLRWHRHHRHCGLCGTETKPSDGGHVRQCPKDGEKHFPRTDPAVMVLVEHEGRCVLARQARWPAGMYSVIAGFVEPGESLEGAAARETKEELGLDVTDLRYFRSQPWPFPASLMVGFSTISASDRLTIDETELEHARWFSPDELRKPEGFFYPPPFSLAHHLIAAFLEKQGSG